MEISSGFRRFSDKAVRECIVSMGDLRLSTAIVLGKATAGISRALGLGGGTTMPGRVARGIAPDLMQRLAGRLRHGSVIVTGTNGKTTTARLISYVFELAGLVPVHNRAGANLAAGITAALVQHASLDGNPRGDVGIFEVDEATLPLIHEALTPRVLVFTNLFRDQLDRYGEIDLVAARWRAALAQLPHAAAVVFNADDPLVSEVGADHMGRRLPFGIDDPSCALEGMEHAADARYCYRCGVPYRYGTVYFGHMGTYECSTCGRVRPTPVVTATMVRRHGIDGSEFTLVTPHGAHPVSTPLPGIYNIHNVLAAAACCLEMGIPIESIVRGVGSFAPAFGRAERVQINDRTAILLLAKNPAGFNEVLRTVVRDPSSGATLVIAINDLTADGRDISWLWDVDFEMLVGHVRHVVVSGIRAEDMALRLKYAGVPPSTITVHNDLARALDVAVELVPRGGRLYILPTYTALLTLRRVLHRRGYVKGFWEH